MLRGIIILEKNLKSLFWCGRIWRIVVCLSKVKLIMANEIE